MLSHQPRLPVPATSIPLEIDQHTSESRLLSIGQRGHGHLKGKSQRGVFCVSGS